MNSPVYCQCTHVLLTIATLPTRQQILRLFTRSRQGDRLLFSFFVSLSSFRDPVDENYSISICMSTWHCRGSVRLDRSRVRSILDSLFVYILCCRGFRKLRLLARRFGSRLLLRQRRRGCIFYLISGYAVFLSF